MNSQYILKNIQNTFKKILKIFLKTFTKSF